MKERPILFSAPMVQAILEGRKTQTRRILKPQPTGEFFGFLERPIKSSKDPSVLRAWFGGEPSSIEITCPYGKAGDSLWVRENFEIIGVDADDEEAYAKILFMADEKEVVSPPLDGYWNQRKTQAGQAMNFYKKKGIIPSIFLPRWASRIEMLIKNVRVERLWDISEEDAKAEGVIDSGHGYRKAFGTIWAKINGVMSLTENPWVWVIEFERVKP